VVVVEKRIEFDCCSVDEHENDRYIVDDDIVVLVPKVDDDIVVVVDKNETVVVVECLQIRDEIDLLSGVQQAAHKDDIVVVDIADDDVVVVDDDDDIVDS
jgi:hypothetical protein